MLPGGSSTPVQLLPSLGLLRRVPELGVQGHSLRKLILAAMAVNDIVVDTVFLVLEGRLFGTCEILTLWSCPQRRCRLGAFWYLLYLQFSIENI